MKCKNFAHCFAHWDLKLLSLAPLLVLDLKCRTFVVVRQVEFNTTERFVIGSRNLDGNGVQADLCWHFIECISVRPLLRDLSILFTEQGQLAKRELFNETGLHATDTYRVCPFVENLEACGLSWLQKGQKFRHEAILLEQVL